LTLTGHSRSSEMAPISRWHTSSYSSSIVTIAISCIVSKINQDTGQKSYFSYSLLHNKPPGKNRCKYFRGVLCHNWIINHNMIYAWHLLVLLTYLFTYTYRSATGSLDCRSSVLVNCPIQLNPSSSSSRLWRRPFSSANRLSSLASSVWRSSWTVAWAICSRPQCLRILPDLPLHNHTGSWLCLSILQQNTKWFTIKTNWSHRLWHKLCVYSTHQQNSLNRSKIKSNQI